MGTNVSLTFSSSGSLRARANSLLSMTDAAATSKGVEPRMEGEAEEGSRAEQRRGEERRVNTREVNKAGQGEAGFRI